MPVTAVKPACWAISLPWSQVIEARTARGRSATMVCKASVTVAESWQVPRRLMSKRFECYFSPFSINSRIIISIYYRFSFFYLPVFNYHFNYIWTAFNKIPTPSCCSIPN